MKKLTLIITTLLLTFSGAVWSQNLVREYRGNDLEVAVWVDRDDGTYYAGDGIEIYFQTNADAHVAIYSVDTRGNVSLLFPVNPWEDGFVRGGEINVLPRQQDDFDLVVRGPEGTEYIQAVASPGYLNVPDWFDGSGVNCEPQDDREKFIDYVNNRYFNCDDCQRAFGTTSIYIHAPRYYSRPVYVQEPWHGTYGAVVYVDYPFGGEVYIDGIFIGYAPLYIPRVYIGYHVFTIYDRFGYCWERNYYVYHDNVIFLDRTLIHTNRYTTSRYKDIRVQARKYPRSKVTYSTQEITTARKKYSHVTSTTVRTKTGTTRTYDAGGTRTTFGGSKKGSSGSSTPTFGGGSKKQGTVGKFGSTKPDVSGTNKRSTTGSTRTGIQRSTTKRPASGTSGPDSYKSGATKRSAPSSTRTPSVKSPSSSGSKRSGETSTPSKGTIKSGGSGKKSPGRVERRSSTTSGARSARSALSTRRPSGTSGAARVSKGSSSTASRSSLGTRTKSSNGGSAASLGKTSSGTSARGGKRR